jgi:hypothetical protein
MPRAEMVSPQPGGSTDESMVSAERMVSAGPKRPVVVRVAEAESDCIAAVREVTVTAPSCRGNGRPCLLSADPAL